MKWMQKSLHAFAAPVIAACLLSAPALASEYVRDPNRIVNLPASEARPDAQNAVAMLLPNGSFETNGGVGTNSFSGWTVVDQAGGSGSWFAQSGTTSPVSSSAVNAPTLGSFAAMTDQTGPGSHVLYQDIQIPAEGAFIGFDLFINNQTAAFSVPSPESLDYSVSPNQQFRVDLMNPAAGDFDVGAGVVQTLYRTQPGDALVSGYTRITRFVPGTGSPRTLRLRFAEVDNQNFFNVGVDNVTLLPNTPASAIPVGDWRLLALILSLVALVSIPAIRRH